MATKARNVLSNATPWERLDQDNAVLLLVDTQAGLFSLTRDWDHTVYYNNMMAHAALGKLYNLPVILTTSTDQGPNGPTPKEILDMYPDAPLIRRQGEISAWDSADFRKAVEATGRKQVIIGGIVTDVCTTFLALAMRAEGYSVFVNVEASGTTTVLCRDTANDRMRQAGVYVVSLFYIIADLLKDWNNPPGAIEALPWMGKYFPAFGMLSQAHAGAVKEGILMPGEG